MKKQLLFSQKLFLGFILLFLITDTISSQTVNALQWLQSQPLPIFKPQYSLPKLGQMYCGNPSVEFRAELANRYGYAVRLDRTEGETVLLNLCATNPQKYKPAGQIGNLSNLKKATNINWPAGTFLSSGELSPEMPDAAWQIYIDYAIAQIQKNTGTLPATSVSNIENWTEYGISVPATYKNLAKTDPMPEILDAKGTRSWVDYVSQRKGYYEKKMRDAIKEKYPNALYTAYGYGGNEHSSDTLSSWVYKYMKDGSDYPGNESYFNYFNSGFAFNKDMFTQMTNARYDEISNGSPYFYHWLCAGYVRDIKTYQGATSQGMYAPLDKWMGYLKISYVAGMLGGITTGEFHCDVNFDETFDIATPHKWLDQIAVLGQAHALFSWLEPVLRNSDLLEGPYKHKWNTTHPAYEFTQDNTKVMVRRTKNQNQWLICAWAMDGVERDVTVNIPDLGDYTIHARTCGTVYLVEKDGSTVNSKWYDENGMYPSLTASQINGNYVQAKDIRINPEYTPLSIGESTQLTVVYNPTNTTNKSVVWSSSDNSIATVSASGLVKRIAAGSADIIATDQEMGLKAVFKLTIPITGISLDITSKTLTGATTQQLNATLYPATATIKSVTWSSNNTSVVTVSASGLITTVGAGTAVITATADDYSQVKADCNITVINVAVSSISFTNKFINIGSSLTLIPTYSPSNALNKALTWGASSDVNVMTITSDIDNKLLVKGVSVGKASVTATTVDGAKSATSTVFVTAPLNGKNFFSSKNSGTTNNVDGYLGYQFTPTSDFSIYALGRYSNGDLKYNHTIKLWNVTDQSLVSSIVITPTSAFDILGYQYEKLPIPILLKEGTAYRIVSEEKVGGDLWKPLGALNSYDSRANLNYGVSGVLGNNVFPATIASGSVAGYGYGSPTFLISPATTSIKITKPYKNIGVGKKTQLLVAVSPVDANQSGSWSSSNNSIATVDNNGLVTGLSPGTVKIYFNTDIDLKKDSSIVNVYDNFREKRYYLIYGLNSISNLPQLSGTPMIDYRPNGVASGSRSNVTAPLSLISPDPTKGFNGQTNYYDYSVTSSDTPTSMNWNFNYFSSSPSVPALDFREIDNDWKLHLSFRTNIASDIIVYFRGTVENTLKLGTFKNDNVSWNELDISMKYFMDQEGWTNTTTNVSTLGNFVYLTSAVNIKILGLKTLTSINNYELAVDDIYFSVLADSSNTTSIDDIQRDARIRFVGNIIKLNEGDGIELFSITGVLLNKTNNNFMNIENLATGVYLIKTPYGVNKFIKK